ncbi:hypothetical protein AGMMS4957_02500 [Bacteroidia bacterium]|nr:hypothetical protein AGMMS4957_02500 [Bacteroidia bacterium]
MVTLDIAGISLGEVQTGAYSLVVHRKGEPSRTIPIIIGTSEAQSIEYVLEELIPPRPLTHDLFVTFMKEVGAVLTQVEISHQVDGVFYSQAVFAVGKKTVRLDARTSDAVALAVRTKAPILMDDALFAEMTAQPVPREEMDLHVTREHRALRSKKTAEHLEQLPVEQLQEQLQHAIAKENYERAALLTKLIKKKS